MGQVEAVSVLNLWWLVPVESEFSGSGDHSWPCPCPLRPVIIDFLDETCLARRLAERSLAVPDVPLEGFHRRFWASPPRDAGPSRLLSRGACKAQSTPSLPSALLCLGTSGPYVHTACRKTNLMGSLLPKCISTPPDKAWFQQISSF